MLDAVLAGISNHKDLPAGSTSIFAKAACNKGLHSSREMKMFVYIIWWRCVMCLSLCLSCAFYTAFRPCNVHETPWNPSLNFCSFSAEHFGSGRSRCSLKVVALKKKTHFGSCVSDTCHKAWIPLRIYGPMFVSKCAQKLHQIWRILQKFSGFCIRSFSWSSVNVPNCENLRGPIHFVAQEKEEFLNSYNLLHIICQNLREILG